MRVLFIIHFLLFMGLSIISRAESHTLFKSGKTDYVILVSNDASISEKYAASELQYWLKEISGVTIPIVNDTRRDKRKRIIIGYYSAVMKSFNIQRPRDDDQGFLYGNQGEDIYILGGRNYGTLYGVYSFLENEFSCRWYTKDVSVAPKRKSWTFKKIYDKESPAFEYRNVYYYDALDVNWSLRNKNNGEIKTKQTIFGPISTSNKAIWGYHTFIRLVPPEIYFMSHPEFFSLRDGKRTKDQLCLSNSSVFQLCKEKLRETILTNPFYKIYSITQNDNSKSCQCENCQQLVKKYGGEAGLMVWFVNKIAASLEPEFPDKFFGTFAYSYTRHAPKNIKPRSNVIIRLCSDGSCESHALGLCDKNVPFVNDLSQWSEITSNIYIWDYVVSFNQYLLPFPNIKLLQSNIQLYKKYKVHGVMNEGIYNSSGGDFSELRAYLLAKLLWNPDVETDGIIDDFMQGYYQGSSSYMKAYFDKIQSLPSGKNHLNHNVTDKNSIYSTDFINSSMFLLNMAENAANSQEILERVQRQKMVIAFIKCRKDPELAIQEGLYDFVMIMTQKFGIKKYAERGEIKSIEDFKYKMEKVKKAMNNKYSKEFLEYKLSKFLENIKI